MLALHLRVPPDMLLQSENDWLPRGPACGIPNDDTCAVDPGPLSAVASGLREAADSERAAAAELPAAPRRKHG